MSTVLACHYLVPATEQPPVPLSYEHAAERVGIERTLAINDAILDIELPQPRSIGSLSRAGLLMNVASLRCHEAITSHAQRDPTRVGVYTALENGPDDFDHALRMVGTDPESFAGTYRSTRSPKQHFRFLANIPGSYVSIFLGSEGPVHVFTHSRYGVAHALAQAEFDLAYGTVSVAVVCSAFSLESPLISIRSSMDAPPDSTLCEGAACLVLVANSRRSDWLPYLKATCRDRFFGIADPLVCLCQQMTPVLVATDRGQLHA